MAVPVLVPIRPFQFCGTPCYRLIIEIYVPIPEEEFLAQPPPLRHHTEAEYFKSLPPANKFRSLLYSCLVRSPLSFYFLFLFISTSSCFLSFNVIVYVFLTGDSPENEAQRSQIDEHSSLCGGSGTLEQSQIGRQTYSDIK